jgi:hypothetical protein
MLHQSPWKGVFIITGGGSEFLAQLLSEAGASATVLDAQIPYSTAALRQILGATPDQACSDATARAMAMMAFQRALELTSLDPDAGSEESQLFGLGITASLATIRSKRGAHRAHLAIQTAGETWTLELPLNADRASEEAQLVATIWQLLAQTLHFPHHEPLQKTQTTSSAAPLADAVRTVAAPVWRDLILGDAVAIASADHDGQLLLPGAFNPLHEGHRQMLEIAEALTGRRGAFELSIANVDKPVLDYQEIAARLAQFDSPVWLTHLPTFIEKARHFRGATFVVGLDTLLRIADERYYTSEVAMFEAFEEFEALDTRFVVFGRNLDPASFKVLDDVVAHLPPTLASRCVGVDAETFNNPLSSSTLRRRQLPDDGASDREH